MKPDLLDGLEPQECSLKVEDSDQDNYTPDFIIRFRIEPYSDVLVRRIMSKLTYVLSSCGCSFSRSGMSYVLNERAYTEKVLYRITCNISKALKLKCYKDAFLLASIGRVVGEELDEIYEDYATTDAPLKVWKLADAMRMLGEVKYGRIEIEGGEAEETPSQTIIN
jgi:hypothetical protein